MRITFAPDQTLYHGTINIYAQVIQECGIDIIKRKNDGVDFGPGFYLSVGDLEQAKQWARDRARYPVYHGEALDKIGITRAQFKAIKAEVVSVVLAFKIKDPDKWLELRHKVFKFDGISWKQFVWEGRQLTEPPSEYDWAFGPLADGGISGTTPIEVRSRPGGNQLSIHNKSTAEMLELVEVISC